MRNRSLAAACCVFGALVLAAQLAAAGIQRKPLFLGRQGPVGIAVGANGRVHVSWQSNDYHLHYAWLEGAKKRDAVVDDGSPGGWWSSIALDSAGHPHIAYQAEPTNPPGQVLRYAHFDGSQWLLEDLGDGGYATAIAIDADDQPHIVHATGTGAFEYLHRDAGGWEHESPGTFGAAWFTPMSLALDSAGHAHVGLEEPVSHHPIYATNASGSWTAGELASSNARGASIAIDSLDLPRAAMALSEVGTIRYSRFDGASWNSEDLYDPNGLSPGVHNQPVSAALALDAQDRPQILFVTKFSGPGGSPQVPVYSIRDGAEWRLGLLEGLGAFDFVGLVRDGNGVGHGVYTVLRPERELSKYVKVTLPDLSGEWTSLAASEKNGMTHVDGVLAVRNDGTDRSKGARIALYLSDDATLDPADTWLFLPTMVGSVPVGKTRNVRFSFTRMGSWSGKHLIAVIDPARLLDDLDRPNNTNPGQLP
jgi:hypothetical protein